ncbi:MULTISPECIES: hypothetical protein [Cyanophyceae]|uniref:hypothetical protein n=1 Tax=Cyanophyceae TaxID=3028117 RepID=UPI00232C5F2B|nr:MULTISPECIES: hypothetical protein [Cyanophyceae]MDB9358188.1 hypothetical protein [Nodularia spumigena CS-587/03]MDB9317854.1 hypothetical protein [Nodularia spumigena CS-590/01A]MDB9328579.1 hypothetical protein [Nodularia spumigena CS-590/02]MDB9337475.1 hypothetical protein [Nodularia spumigena CS-590/01]MDB9338591.1 hypothetical protein [Nodularia spumigena CS-589/07]
MDTILIEHKNHDIYFSLANDNLVNAQTLYREILESGRVIPMADDRYIVRGGDSETSSWFNLKLLQLKKFVISSIIFSALTVEAFINYYAISKGMSMKKIKGFKAKYYERELMSPDEIQEQYQLPDEQRTTIKKWIADSAGGVHMSDTVVRWIEIPFQHTGNYIPSGLDGTLIYELNELFRLRNKLVHHKAKVFKLDLNEFDLEGAEDDNYVTLLEAQGAFDVVIKSVKALQQIDNDIDLNWLGY